MRSVLFAAVLLAVVAAGIVSQVRVAEALPSRYFGVVTIDGARAPAGTVVIAEINGKDCSTNVGFSGDPGPNNYNIDVLSDGESSGCAGVGSNVVFFKVGGRYATQISCFSAGAFVELALTISGTAQRPIPSPTQCGPVATPAPDASPSPSPAPSATPAPSASPFSLSILDLSSPCIPVGASVACDAERTALWTGNQEAWRARLQMQGRPSSPDDIFVATLTFRVEVGDPATIGGIATRLGWPHVRILASRYRGQSANELDEWVEVKNIGGGAQDMGGWSVRLPGTMVFWRFQEGFTLQPNQACKFYTGSPMADPCPGSSNVATSGVLNNSSGTIELWVDFLDLKAIEARYNADPNNQPPPPNLQGFS